MKKLIAAAALAAAAFLTTGSALAQTTHEVRTYVPYDFTVGNKVLPAGHYRIDAESSPVSANEVRIQNVDQPGLVVLVRGTDEWQALPTSTVSRGFLTFDQYGDHHFLRAVRAPLAAVNVEVPVSTSEQRARRNERTQTALSTPHQTTLAGN